MEFHLAHGGYVANRKIDSSASTKNGGLQPFNKKPTPQRLSQLLPKELYLYVGGWDGSSLLLGV